MLQARFIFSHIPVYFVRVHICAQVYMYVASTINTHILYACTDIHLHC
jgi:hypothetical protein